MSSHMVVTVDEKCSVDELFAETDSFFFVDLHLISASRLFYILGFVFLRGRKNCKTKENRLLLGHRNTDKPVM